MTCKENEKVELTEFAKIIEQLRADEKNDFLLTLRPTENDCKFIFLEGESVRKAIAYSEKKWADVSKIPVGSMKPRTENAESKILSVTKDELQRGETKGLPEDYLKIAEHLKDGITLYSILYLNEDGTEQKQRAAFFKVSEKWIIIPRTFKAFE